MKCKHCGKDKDTLTPSGFCSRSCANSRAHSHDTRVKIAESVRNNTESHSKKSKSIRKKWEDPEWRDRVTKSMVQAAESVGWDNMKWGGKRKWIIRDQEGKCKRCGADEWLGEPLSLEVDHIDGDRNNNSRDNLEALCPNCHSITPTWRGKKKALLSL